MSAFAAVSTNGSAVGSSASSGTTLTRSVSATSPDSHTFTVCGIVRFTPPSGVDDLVSVVGNTSGAYDLVALEAGPDFGSGATSYFYIYAHEAVASETITATWTNSANAKHMICQNFDGVDSGDPYTDVGFTQASSTSHTITLTPTYDHAYAFIFAATYFGGTATLSAGTNTSQSFLFGFNGGSGLYAGTTDVSAGVAENYTINRASTGRILLTGVYLNPYSPTPPSPISFQGWIDAADSGYESTTGFTAAAAVAWTGDNLIKVFIGSGMSVLYYLRYWILALIIVALVVYFAFRAFVFFRH